MDFLPRNEIIKQDYALMKSLTKVGKKYNLTKQRIQQIVNPKRYVKKTNAEKQRLRLIIQTISKTSKLEGIDLLRDKVRQRDQYTCRMCGIMWDLGKRRLDIHHIDVRMESVKDYKYDKANTDKLITLCHKCHLRTHYIIKQTFEVLGLEFPEKLSPLSLDGLQ